MKCSGGRYLIVNTLKMYNKPKLSPAEVAGSHYAFGVKGSRAVPTNQRASHQQQASLTLATTDSKGSVSSTTDPTTRPQIKNAAPVGTGSMSGIGLKKAAQYANQQMSPQGKKVTPAQTGPSRYESLQSKLKNKRRQTTTNSNSNILAMTQVGNNSNSRSNLAGGLSGKQNMTTTDNSAASKVDQKNLAMSAASSLLNSAKPGNSRAVNQISHAPSGPTASNSYRKHLKLSIDNIDSSFNNLTIKSDERQNSGIRGAAVSQPLSAKNANVAASYREPNPTGSYQSHFAPQCNSRFTANRPRNPNNDGYSSSVSSKDSESTSRKFVPVLDLKKQVVKAAQAQINVIREQDSQRVSQVTPPDEHPENNQQKAPSTAQSLKQSKLYQNVNAKVVTQPTPSYKSKFSLNKPPPEQHPKPAQKKSFTETQGKPLQAVQEKRSSIFNSTLQKEQKPQSGFFSPKNQTAKISAKPSVQSSGYSVRQQYTTAATKGTNGSTNYGLGYNKKAMTQSNISIGSNNHSKQSLIKSPPRQELTQPVMSPSAAQEAKRKAAQLPSKKQSIKPTPREGDPLAEEKFEDSLNTPAVEKKTAPVAAITLTSARKSNNHMGSFTDQEAKTLMPLQTNYSTQVVDTKKSTTKPTEEEEEQPPTVQEIQEVEAENSKSSEQSSNLKLLKEQLKQQIYNSVPLFRSNPQQPSSATEVEDIQYPITPARALKLFKNNLTDYECNEILQQNEVYFLGLESAKIKGSSLNPHNYGYDDDRGDYKVTLKDHIAYRYEVLETIGKGSFGQALKCYDYKTNSFVALKIIRNKKRFHHQAGVELKILQYLKEHDPDDVYNIIRMKDYVVFRKHLVIGFELLSINLYEFIKNNNFQGISIGLIRRFAIQILQSLKYLRDHEVVHCDLKPENILLKTSNKSGIKIIDFGSSCFQDERIYTYIQSRFYRAPEIILGIPYTAAIDMWSFGCILAELYTGFPLFPGENEVEQLAYIMEIKGVPSQDILEMSSRRKLFFDQNNDPILVANSRGKKRRPLTKTLESVTRCSDDKFLSFLNQCIDWDPRTRMSPLEALQHEWILEGLPPKVLLHHQKMFGVPISDSKPRIKPASIDLFSDKPKPVEQAKAAVVMEEKKKNKTIQGFMSELFDEKQKEETPAAQNPSNKHHVVVSEGNGPKVIEFHPKPQQDEKKIDEDMEEGAHFSQTQKIPISLIKQTDAKAMTFYNPAKPKLNSYLANSGTAPTHQKKTSLNSSKSNSMAAGLSNTNRSNLQKTGQSSFAGQYSTYQQPSTRTVPTKNTRM